MFKSILNEVKNTVINTAIGRVTGALNGLSSGSNSNWRNPHNRGGVFSANSNYARTTDPFESETVIYPEDLGSEDQGHYVLFNINEQSNANINFGNAKSNNNAYASYLKRKEAAASAHAAEVAAMGPDIAGEFSWSEEPSPPSNDPMGKDQMYGSGHSKIRSGPNMFDNFSGFTSNVAETAKGAVSDIQASQGGETFIEKSIRGSLEMIPGLSGLGAAMDIERGCVRNNRMEMIFEGIGRRSFSFTFKCMPKSEQEAKDVDRITRMFRYYMAPSFIGDRSKSRTMIVPSTFDIAYMYKMGERNNFINQISTAVLESCNITYGGERVQFYRPTTGMFGSGAPPVETQIELNFKELEIITKERINDGY